MADFYFDASVVNRRQSISRTIARPAKASVAEPLATHKSLPKSPVEWKKALAEIKREYINRKYRACHTRCVELVENTKNQHVENAHMLYVRFYAASAIEMQVRSLQQNSSYRTKLLLEAREHYRAASDLAAAEDASKRRPSSRSFSPVPSLHSSSPSDSRSITPPTSRGPSPSPSLDSCLKSSISAPKPKKRVAFIGVPTYEPIIRPDSPTLGFDDWLSPPASPEPVIASAPEPAPLDRMDRGLSSLPLPSPTLSIASTDSMSSSPSPLSSPTSDDGVPDVDYFLSQRSVHQYCTILASLQRQISSHLSWLDQDIAAAMAPQPPTIMTDELRALELRTRIERLRANGWKRARFDVSRYEALRESALGDIN
ncbi:hypothetical protein ESCO_000754 [Escovopsis weberi]|uniref:Uncharacterized protein n=1 Tax=Escovopsis weberi TaxID=150374 RepID=A0A0N0RT93_ESCWE|nr:hypothetical protein ESCO_000754 [Escovopsis weberi]